MPLFPFLRYGYNSHIYATNPPEKKTNSNLDIIFALYFQDSLFSFPKIAPEIKSHYNEWLKTSQFLWSAEILLYWRLLTKSDQRHVNHFAKDGHCKFAYYNGEDCSIMLTVPILQIGKLRTVTRSGFIFINNQQNSIIYLKPLIFTKTLPQNASAVYCDLKHVLLGGPFSFPASQIHCRFLNWQIHTLFPRQPNLSLPHKHTYKQAILRKRRH